VHAPEETTFIEAAEKRVRADSRQFKILGKVFTQGALDRQHIARTGERNLVGKPERMRICGRPKCRWKGNIKTVQDIQCDDT
jgi:hypothetical protein